MKKSLLLSLFTVFALVSTGYTAHPTGSVTTVAAQATSPWSGVAWLETERNATGDPQSGFGNLMFINVGRSILEDTVSDLSAAIRLYGQNKFEADMKKSGFSRHFEILEPTFLLTKGNLFSVNVAGTPITASAQTRFYAPFSLEARIDNRNPHSGNWRQVLALEANVGRWLFESANLAQYYGYDNAVQNDGSFNDRYRVENDVTAIYQLTDVWSLKSSLEFDHRWKRVENETSSTLEWVNTAIVSPITNFTVEAGVVIHAANQAIRNFTDEPLENTRARLDLSYKFL